MNAIPHLVVRAPCDCAESLYPVLYRWGYAGLIECDAAHGLLWQVFLAPDADAAALRDCLAECIAVDPKRINGEVATLPVEDWAARWKEHFQPLTIAPGLVVVAEGVPYVARTGERIIAITAGMAFGTGQHATTQLMARAIAADAPQRRWQRMLDVGTGTGILAFVAAVCGVPCVNAVDTDPEAVRVARGGAAANGLAERVAFYDTIEATPGPYDAIVANILLEPLCELAPAFRDRLVPGGDCYLSGVLAEQLPILQRRFETVGFRTVKTTAQEEWAALQVRR
ncbi:MAG: 50S ribosomal protein L11 methyltransferase [Deltaproteobacteria bacterium]|nr:50S ribosomal protein L11 methyltransferase [Deltaproteobacteria bacterium]